MAAPTDHISLRCTLSLSQRCSPALVLADAVHGRGIGKEGSVLFGLKWSLWRLAVPTISLPFRHQAWLTIDAAFIETKPPRSEPWTQAAACYQYLDINHERWWLVVVLGDCISRTIFFAQMLFKYLIFLSVSLTHSIVLVLYMYDKKCHRVESIVAAYKGVMMAGRRDREDGSIAKETSSLFPKQ